MHALIDQNSMFIGVLNIEKECFIVCMMKCCHDDEIHQALCNMVVIRLLLYLAST